jgi:hypothetical protein
MRNLIELKREAIAKHLPKIIEQKTKANEELMKLMTKAITDKKINAKGGLDILNKINASGQVGAESSNNMTGEQRLELAKLWFVNAQNTMNSLDSDIKANYESYMKSIDQQMENLQREIESIDQEIAKEQDKDKREELRDYKDRAYSRAS